MSSLKKFIKPLMILFLIASIFSAIGIYNLYSQVLVAFQSNPEMIPTRIYADIVKISSPQQKSYVIRRLKRLGYSFSSDSHVVSFKLNPVNYPEHLLPENHPTAHLKNTILFLNFESDTPQASLVSIQTETGQ